MPQILGDKKWADQGRINVPEMMKLLKVSQNTAYRLRWELLKDYDQQKEGRAAQYGNSNMEEKPSSSQQVEKTP